jgi:hypothetical protein
MVGFFMYESRSATVFYIVVLKCDLLKYISVGLSKQPGAGSRYGCGIVSDFDLYYNMATDKLFNDMLDKVHFDYNDKVKYNNLKKNRTNLRQWLIRLRNNLIMDLELPETPDKNELARAKKARTMKTPEQVQKEATEELANARAGTKRTVTTEMDCDEDNTTEQDCDPVISDLTISAKRSDRSLPVEATATPPLIAGLTADRQDRDKVNKEVTDLVNHIGSVFHEFKKLGQTITLKLDTSGAEHCLLVAVSKHVSMKKWEGAARISLEPHSCTYDPNPSIPPFYLK